MKGRRHYMDTYAGDITLSGVDLEGENNLKLCFQRQFIRLKLWLKWLSHSLHQIDGGDTIGVIQGTTKAVQSDVHDHTCIIKIPSVIYHWRWSLSEWTWTIPQWLLLVHLWCRCQFQRCFKHSRLIVRVCNLLCNSTLSYAFLFLSNTYSSYSLCPKHLLSSLPGYNDMYDIWCIKFYLATVISYTCV